MKRLMIGMVACLVGVGSASAADSASSRYLRHPVFQSLPEMEVRVETQFGYGDTGDLPFGLLGAFGIGLSDALTAGIYGQVFTSDRDLPNEVDIVYGVGGFGEYAMDFGSAMIPFVGLRLGMLDPTGPSSPTVPYAGGYLGLKYRLTPKVSASVAVNLHWAGDKDDYEAYDYKRSGSGYSDDSSAVTFDAGLRYAF